MSQRANDEMWTEDEPRGGTGRAALILLTLAVLVSIGYHTFHIIRERQNLHAIRENQQAGLRQAERVRTQFDSLVKRMLELAQQGNTGAATLVEQLARRGITIKPDAVQTTPPATQSPATK